MDHLLNRIRQAVVCEACHDEFIAGRTDAKSLQSYTALDVGFTDRGLQVWCRRHDCNVVHVDFAGHKLAADFRRVEPNKGDA
jgi:hypothetical protein